MSALAFVLRMSIERTFSMTESEIDVVVLGRAGKTKGGFGSGRTSASGEVKVWPESCREADWDGGCRGSDTWAMRAISRSPQCRTAAELSASHKGSEDVQHPRMASLTNPSREAQTD